MSSKYQKYKPGLDYLKKNGLDLIVKQDFIIKSVITYQEHSYFGETKEDLPKPYKLAGNVISIDFMNHYDFITKVDLARFLRVVSIILTNFTGPKEEDHFNAHIWRLQDLCKAPSPENESLVMEALLAYDEVLGSKKNLLKEDYIAFARILNYLWYIFEPAEEASGSNDKLADDFEFDDYGYDDSVDEEFDFAKDYEQYVGWVYKEIFRDLDDKKLLKQINDDTQRNTLMLSLKQCNLGEYTDKQLKDLVKKKKDREKLIKKVNDWYAKEYPS